MTDKRLEPTGRLLARVLFTDTDAATVAELARRRDRRTDRYLREALYARPSERAPAIAAALLPMLGVEQAVDLLAGKKTPYWVRQAVGYAVRESEWQAAVGEGLLDVIREGDDTNTEPSPEYVQVLDVLSALSGKVMRMTAPTDAAEIERYAVGSLGCVGYPGAVPKLLGYLGRIHSATDWPALSGEALHALGNIGDPRAFQPVLDLLYMLTDPAYLLHLHADVERKVIEGRLRSVLRTLGDLGDLRAIPYLARMLTPRWNGVWFQAVDALGCIDHADAVPVLVHFLLRDGLRTQGHIRAVEVLRGYGTPEAIHAVEQYEEAQWVRWQTTDE